MVKQMNLFEMAYEDYEPTRTENEANASILKQTQEFDYRLFDDCPKCKVKPVAFWSKPQVTMDGMQRSRVATCPICGYMVASHYNIYEHWNTCNKYRVRDGKI